MRSSSYIFDCQNVDCNTFPEMEKKKKNDIYVWLSCVVLQAGLLWLCILDYGQKMISRFSKILVLYRCSKKKKRKSK